MSADSAASLAPHTRQLQRWLALAVGSLWAAGFLSLLLMLGRVPPFSYAFADPILFRRFLVVHVNLALVVWFYAALAALFHLLPVAAAPSLIARAGFWLAGGGVLSLMITVALPQATPILSNYVPVLDHPLFIVGLTLIASGIIASLLGPRLLPRRELPGDLTTLPAAARPGLRAAAIAFLLGVLTCLGAIWGTPSTMSPQAYYELLFWGCGHVLQFANAAIMLTIWIMLVSRTTGVEPLLRKHSAGLFGLLLLPLFAAPILAMSDTTSGAYRTFFTRLMELGIFPVSTVVLFACLRTLYRHPSHQPWRDVRITGFFVSALLTVVGFILGACIHGSNTLIPAHYHATLGGVTVSVMTITFVLLGDLRNASSAPRWLRWVSYQPLLFGAGQGLFVLGFALAGSQGMGRKTYGTEQHVRTALEVAGLRLAGVGGVLAVVGGIFFLAAVISIWRARSTVCAPSTSRRTSWNTQSSLNIPSSG